MKRQEKRARVRMPKYLGAKIEFNNRQSLIDCIIRNQSRDGALLKIETPVDVPEMFDLHVNKTEHHFRCQVAWKRPNEVGVRFCSETGRRHRPTYLRPVS